ncbi:MAG: sigma-70 family RNA polymerase sigma factor [Acidimicrobiales bacterium]
MTARATRIEATGETECASWSDGDLMAAVKAHREDAFDEIFRRHARSVAAVTRMILGHRPECDDVVSEVFIGLWRSPETFDSDRGSLLTFLRVKARGRCIDLVRSETARARREKSQESQRGSPADVDSSLLSAEIAAQVRRALASLPSEEREPIELAYFEGMTYREVAVHLDVPEGTVKSRIRGGLRKLRVSGDIRSGTDDG